MQQNGSLADGQAACWSSSSCSPCPHCRAERTAVSAVQGTQRRQSPGQTTREGRHSCSMTVRFFAKTATDGHLHVPREVVAGVLGVGRHDDVPVLVAVHLPAAAGCVDSFVSAYVERAALFWGEWLMHCFVNRSSCNVKKELHPIRTRCQCMVMSKGHGGPGSAHHFHGSCSGIPRSRRGFQGEVKMSAHHISAAWITPVCVAWTRTLLSAGRQPTPSCTPPRAHSRVHTHAHTHTHTHTQTDHPHRHAHSTHTKTHTHTHRTQTHTPHKHTDVRTHTCSHVHRQRPRVRVAGVLDRKWLEPDVGLRACFGRRAYGVGAAI